MFRDFFRSRNSRNKKKITAKRILRAEMLEPRALLSATVLTGDMQGATSAFNPASFVVGAAAPANHAPTVAVAAASASNPVTGKTVQLSVLGADDAGENNLKYAWTTSSLPSGAQAPNFSANGTNAAKHTTVTFKTAGIYNFTATIIDAGRLYATSNVRVTVNQTIASITVTPSITNVPAGGTQQFSATGYDQFGAVLKSQPTFTWTTTLGTINSHDHPGLLTAPGTGGTGTVTASVGLIHGTASMRVVGNLAVAQAASSASYWVTGTTVQLSVLGADGADESNIKYTWTTTFSPSGSQAPTFSVNGANAAKNTTVTFKTAGTYIFTAALADTAGHTASSSVIVSVNSTLTRIAVNPGNATLSAGGTQQFRATGYDQFGNFMTTQPGFTWTSSAGTITPTGLYTAPATTAAATVRAAAGAISSTASVADINHAPTLARAAAASNPAAGATAQLTVLGADDAGEGNLRYNWTALSIPNGALAPTFSTNWSNAAKTTQVTVYTNGAYVFSAAITDAGNLSITSQVTVVVNSTPTLTSIALNPVNVTLVPYSFQQFSAIGLDQFGNALAVQPTFNWSASSGLFIYGGLYMAPATTGSVTVTVSCGAIHGSTGINVITNNNFLGLYDSNLAYLTQSLYIDQSIDRADMITILCSVSAHGPVSENDFLDLKTIVRDAAALNMPGYVKVLANDVVNGSYANAYFQGQNLGNLTAGSSTAKLNSLIDKWFFGSDHPAIDPTFTYHLASGSLFNGNPSHVDEFQGSLGDCYLITGLGMIADSSPAAIRNMFLDNHDGTWTVRFYSNGTADYVTVDAMLPTESAGHLVFADYYSMYDNAANTLWIPLAEKAYVQWNETLNLGHIGSNAYYAINGGSPLWVYAQVLGHSGTPYDFSDPQSIIDAINSHKAVAVGTDQSFLPNQDYGLHTGHAYGVIGYDSQTGTFTLYNPWGFDQPGALTWTQLQATCYGFQVADTTGSISIGAVPNLGAFPLVRAITPTITMNTSQTRQAFSADRNSAFSPGQEPDSTSNKILKHRDRLFAAHSTDGFHIPAFESAWMALVPTRHSSTTPRDLSFLAADEFFRGTASLELNSNSPALLWERIC
ncbi:MAG: C2 family cysteine protease [Thermoguttaceae bacterium]|jgi:hypothetical protein